MVNIFKSLGYSLLGLAVPGSLLIFFIIYLYSFPGPDSELTTFVGETMIVSERLENLNRSFPEIASKFYRFSWVLLTILSSLTLIFSLAWSVGSHYLNIDAPGKAKIYFIHWAIFSAIYLTIMLGVILYFTQSSTWSVAGYINATGDTIFIFSSIYFFLTYYCGVLLGTARFARSSVLLANKLPGNL